MLYLGFSYIMLAYLWVSYFGKGGAGYKIDRTRDGSTTLVQCHEKESKQDAYTTKIRYITYRERNRKKININLYHQQLETTASSIKPTL